jgi:chaperonin GroEL
MIEGFRTLTFDDDARESLRRGVDSLAKAVSVTMGPSGQNVIIEVPGFPPIVTKDGVTVARAIDFRDRNMNLGAQIIKEAASRTCDAAGDGTTTATVLAHAIFNGGLRVLSGDHSSPDVRAGMSWAVNSVIEELKLMAKPVSSDDEIVQVGTISANGEKEIGELLAQAMHAVGRDGTITVEEAKGFSTSLHIVEGSEIDRGYLSPYFVTDSEKMISSLESPYVLLTNSKITTLKEILPILEKIHNSQKPILIVADEIEGEAMQGLVLNRTKGIIQICAIKGPEFGENRFHALQDLAVLLGTKVVTGDSELSKIQISDLGRCKRAIIGRYKSVLVDVAGSKDSIDTRANEIKSQLADLTLEQQDRDALHRRLSRLAGGVAILRVGGATESELKERRDRVDDALHATKAAVEEGILPGGGTALVRAAARVRRNSLKSRSDSFKQGVEVILHACSAPLRQIVTNSGRNPEMVLSRVERLRGNMGYDAATETFVDTVQNGILDPLKVVRCALENAASAANMLLSVGCTITNDSSSE